MITAISIHGPYFYDGLTRGSFLIKAVFDGRYLSSTWADCHTRRTAIKRAKQERTKRKLTVPIFYTFPGEPAKLVSE